MATERTFDTTINLGGLSIEVEVEFTVTSWGAPGSGFSMTGPGEPDEPPEFHITRVIAKDTGLDLTAACNQDSLNVFRLATVLVPDPGQDPIRAILFGLETATYEPVARARIIGFSPIRREIWNGVGTILEEIECEIMQDSNALEPPVDDDWDPRDWE